MTVTIIQNPIIFTTSLSTVSAAMEPEYEDPDAMVSSPSAMPPDELPMQGTDDEPSTITIVPPWVSYKKHLTQRCHAAFQLQRVNH